MDFQEDNMEDVEEAEVEPDADTEANDLIDEDDIEDDLEDEEDEDADEAMEDADGETKSDADGEGDGDGVESENHHSGSNQTPPIRPFPKTRPEAVKATSYDIVPYVAAPQGTSINAFCSTPCMKWIFTGGSDGYIRKYDWFNSINGKVPLTVAQKHPFVDSVTRAGILLSYWENEEPTVKSSLLTVPDTTDDLKLSPVYSLAVQNQALWLLSGLESGGINLQTVRHSEGTIVETLRNHTSAVSVLTLASDERTVLSGSWDRSITYWDLDSGKPIRTFMGSAGQISSIAFRPITSNTSPLPSAPQANGNSTVLPQGGDPASPAESFGSLFGDDDEPSVIPETQQSPPSLHAAQEPQDNVPQSSHTPLTTDSTFLTSSIDGTLRLFDIRVPSPIATIQPPRGVPPWSTSSIWSTDGNHVYVGRRNGTVEEYSIHALNSPSRTIKFPAGSGPVTSLLAMPNGRHLVCASHDNLRMYDLEFTGGGVGFLIVPGHHGGVVSALWRDPECRFLVSCAGNRGWEGQVTEVLLGYEIGCIT